MTDFVIKYKSFRLIAVVHNNNFCVKALRLGRNKTMSEESAAKFVKAVLADEELHKRYQSAAYRLCAVYSRAYNVMSRFITP